MSKKARRRPTWKKDNTYWPKSFKWFFDGHIVTIYPKGIEKELYEILYLKQEPLGEEFEKVLYDNLWDLYVED